MPRSNGTPESNNGQGEVFEFFASTETTTVYLDPNRKIWVRLLNELDFGQQSELDNASLRGVTMENAREAATQGERLMIFDLGHQRRLKLGLYIDDWSLPVKWPAKLDLRIDLVKRLKPSWATMILTEIERLEAAAQKQAEEAGLAAEDSDPNLIRPSLASANEQLST